MNNILADKRALWLIKNGEADRDGITEAIIKAEQAMKERCAQTASDVGQANRLPYTIIEKAIRALT